MAGVAAMAGWIATPPSRYVRLRDRARENIPMVRALMGPPCTKKVPFILPDGRTSYLLETDSSPACIRFDPPREFSGIWIDDFENSSFLDEAKVAPSLSFEDMLTQSSWLSMKEPLHDAIDGNAGKHPHVWRIRYIGRKSSVPSEHGHKGLWNSEITMERIMSVEPVEPALAS